MVEIRLQKRLAKIFWQDHLYWLQPVRIQLFWEKAVTIRKGSLG